MSAPEKKLEPSNGGDSEEGAPLISGPEKKLEPSKSGDGEKGAEVLKASKETRHEAPSCLSKEQESKPPKKKPKVDGSPAEIGAGERIDILHFATRVTTAPAENATKKKNPSEDVRTAARAPVRTVWEDQTLPKFNVRIVPEPRGTATKKDTSKDVRTVSRAPVRTVWEDQTLPKFNVRVKPTPRR